jgi:hypothetical protein
MSLDIPTETAERLAAKAREQGLSINALLERLLNGAGDPTPSAANGKTPILPAWHLGVRGSLHRRDIYDDVD